MRRHVIMPAFFSYGVHPDVGRKFTLSSRPSAQRERRDLVFGLLTTKGLGNIFPNVLVPGVRQFLRVAIENHLAVPENQKT